MALEIDGHTKALGLIGSPVSHSMSPAFHNASFEQLGINAVYLAYDVSPEGLEDAVNALREMGFAGYNVGVPHKKSIIPFLDEVDEGAKLMNAVNTVCIKDGKSIGYNTDGLGFIEALRNHHINPTNLRAVIADIDAEGSAYTAQLALEGARHITVLTESTQVDAIRNRMVHLTARTGCMIDVFDIEDYSSYSVNISLAQVYCNATSIGKKPNIEQSPLPATLLHADLTVMDAVYSPRYTQLINDAVMAGCRTINGLELLLNQAALAEKLWLGCEMPISYLRQRFF